MQEINKKLTNTLRAFGSYFQEHVTVKKNVVGSNVRAIF